MSVESKTGIVPDLYYYRARYYDPMQGRFISQDPIEFLAGDVNFYRYVGGDPVNWVDPSGLNAITALEKGATIARAITPAVARIMQGLRTLFGIATKVPTGTIVDTSGVPHPPITLISSRESVKTVEGIAVKGQNGKCGGSNKNKGDCAEALVNKAYKNAGYKPMDTGRMTNKSGHGIDNIAYNDTEVVVIETKANTSQLSKAQKLGGRGYLKKQLDAMKQGFKGKGGRWASYEGDADLGDAIDELEDLLKNKKSQFKICRVILDDDPTGCYGKGGNGKCEGEVKCEIEWQ